MFPDLSKILSTIPTPVHLTYYTCTCVGIHPGRVGPASPTALTTSRTEALQARRSCASSLDIFTQSFLHRAWPKARGPEIGSRSALIVVAHVFSWPPARLRHVRGGVGRRRSLISSPSRHLDSNQKGERVQTPALSNRTSSNWLELQSPQMQRRRDWGPRWANYP